MQIYSKRHITMYIYKVTNTLNGKIYIGQTHHDNNKYFGSGNLILQALEKYGTHNFSKEYIDEACNQRELDEKEKFWIKELQSQDKKIGYNIADGGWNCLTMNEDIKAKISKTLKGKYVGDMAFRKGLKLSDEHKKAISVANKGKTLSDEHKQKLSASAKERFSNGYVITKETRMKMSNSHKGKTLSEEHKQKISKAGIGRIITEEQKEKLRASNINKKQAHSKTISALCIENNMEMKFNNICEAARYFQTSRFKIKNNSVEGWELKVNEQTKDLK